MHRIASVEPGSIAEELEISPGDVLLAINGQTPADVLDYRFMVQDEELLLEIEKPDGEIWELDIEKDPDTSPGLIFEQPLMDKPRSCQNSCIFCFIDQMPEGLRESLYFKDDDVRLSFLCGNYVTLTNLSDAEAARIAGYHLSPLHISVHALGTVRQKLLRNRRADNLLGHLQKFSRAGITMHFQIVLVKGINDGAVLDDTIRQLAEISAPDQSGANQSGAASLSVVPVGLTRFRDGLPVLLPFNKQDALAVIEQVSAWQRRFLKTRGTRFVFLADEWYLKAGLPMPDYEHYEEFYQLENGVGLWAHFRRECRDTVRRVRANAAAGHGISGHTTPGHGTPCPYAGQKLGIITGTAAAPLMTELAQELEQRLNIHAEVFAIKNHFFGETVTTSGLLTGGDIIRQLAGRNCDMFLLPPNALRAGTDVLLDDVTVAGIGEVLEIPVRVGYIPG